VHLPVAPAAVVGRFHALGLHGSLFHALTSLLIEGVLDANFDSQINVQPSIRYERITDLTAQFVVELFNRS
jgi:hypothetical protein